MGPFRLGDKITGEVYDIGLRYTTLVTHEGDTVLAPNSSLLTAPALRGKRGPPKKTGEAAGASVS